MLMDAPLTADESEATMTSTTAGCNLPRRPDHHRRLRSPGSPRGRNLRDPIRAHPDPVRRMQTSSSSASASGCKTRPGRRSFWDRASLRWPRFSRPKASAAQWSRPQATSSPAPLSRFSFASFHLLFFSILLVKCWFVLLWRLFIPCLKLFTDYTYRMMFRFWNISSLMIKK